RRLARRLGTPRVTLHGAFGTAVVRRDHVRVDLAATRRERYPHPGSLPVVEPAGIEEDLGRRDFTVNAIAAAISGCRFGEVLDPFDGRTDLDAGAIRILHDGSFHDDPTRLFRAVRYASRLGFTIEPHTDGLAREAIAAGLIDALSGARLWAAVLAERLRLRRRDADVVRAAACAPERLGPRLAGAATPADVADLLDSAPIEATLVVAAAGEAGSANAQMYLERVRGVRLEIDGS